MPVRTGAHRQPGHARPSYTTRDLVPATNSLAMGASTTGPPWHPLVPLGNGSRGRRARAGGEFPSARCGSFASVRPRRGWVGRSATAHVTFGSTKSYLGRRRPYETSAIPSSGDQGRRGVDRNRTPETYLESRLPKTPIEESRGRAASASTRAEYSLLARHRVTHRTTALDAFRDKRCA